MCFVRFVGATVDTWTVELGDARRKSPGELKIEKSKIEAKRSTCARAAAPLPTPVGGAARGAAAGEPSDAAARPHAGRWGSGGVAGKGSGPGAASRGQHKRMGIRDTIRRDMFHTSGLAQRGQAPAPHVAPRQNDQREAGSESRSPCRRSGRNERDHNSKPWQCTPPLRVHQRCQESQTRLHYQCLKSTVELMDGSAIVGNPACRVASAAATNDDRRCSPLKGESRNDRPSERSGIV